jgi:hypothetical protein
MQGGREGRSPTRPFYTGRCEADWSQTRRSAEPCRLRFSNKPAVFLRSAGQGQLRARPLVRYGECQCAENAAERGLHLPGLPGFAIRQTVFSTARMRPINRTVAQQVYRNVSGGAHAACGLTPDGFLTLVGSQRRGPFLTRRIRLPRKGWALPTG